MSEQMRAHIQRHDRWFSLLVIAVVAVALLLGWRVKAAAESRATLYEAEGLKLRYPAGWVRAEAKSPVLLQVEDRMSNEFPTGLTVQKRPVPASLAKPLAAVQQTLALERAQQWNAYRELDMEEGVTVGGHSGLHVTFAYVESRANPFLQSLPVVVRGEDYYFDQNGQAYIFTLTASEANYGQAHQALLALIRSW
jgi:hypothetical protein